jgi:Putative bacterial sensory transduction regulator
MKALLISTALSAFALSSTATAQMVRAQDPQSVANALQNAGYKAELTKDPTGDPLVKSSSSGSSYEIYFYNCTKNAECRTIQFSSAYSRDTTPTAAHMNEWNSTNRFARAYVTPKGIARVEMDVDLDDGGMSKLLFEDNLEYWVMLMAGFEKHLDK